MLLIALLAAIPTPSDDAIREQAVRCGLTPSHLFWMEDAEGKRQLHFDGDLPAPSARSTKCMVRWANQNGVSIASTSQSPQARPTPAPVRPIPAGIYLCTVLERAGIGSIHIEGSGPPEAFATKAPPTRFKIQIKPNRNRAKPYRAIEVAYDGPDRDQAEWEDANSVLHSVYLGNGEDFYAVDGPAFLSLYRTYPGNPDGDIGFYHSGFESPGGEDTNLSVRWGRCRKM